MPDINNEKRELYAEFLSERIYGAITLMAVNISLLVNITTVTIGHAYAVIIFTTLGLWAASLFAFFMSYKIVHGQLIPRAKLARSVVAHRGILDSALPSIILLAVAAMGIISIETALIVDIALAATTMAVMTIQASKSTYGNVKNAIISVAIQFIIGAAIIGIKLAIH